MVEVRAVTVKGAPAEVALPPALPRRGVLRDQRPQLRLLRHLSCLPQRSLAAAQLPLQAAVTDHVDQLQDPPPKIGPRNRTNAACPIDRGALVSQMRRRPFTGQSRGGCSAGQRGSSSTASTVSTAACANGRQVVLVGFRAQRVFKVNDLYTALYIYLAALTAFLGWWARFPR